MDPDKTPGQVTADHYSTALAHRPTIGPATSADLLELDAVLEPVDSDAPRDVHARTLARARP